MYLILAVISPGVIDIWEGLLTFAFFPLTVFTAYVTDIKFIQVIFIFNTIFLIFFRNVLYRIVIAAHHTDLLLLKEKN